ncbi:MAG TPA: hypothetical protein VF815_41040, partial [Myxococcaceae bacterium]
YVAAPGFQRRRERMWAWRARPSRPATYAAIALILLVLGYQVASRLQPPPMDDPYHPRYGDPYTAPADEDVGP